MTEGITTRERLILASMDEVRSYGVEGFSLRRVAASCGVSCAAPYKHFADKQELFAEMIIYINGKWRERLEPLINTSGTTADAIALTAVDYVRFLSENPPFRAMLTIRDMGLDNSLTAAGAWPSAPIKRIFVRHARERGFDRDEIRRRIFAVRSLVYGASMIIGTEDSPDDNYFSMLDTAVRRAVG